MLDAAEFSRMSKLQTWTAAQSEHQHWMISLCHDWSQNCFFLQNGNILCLEAGQLQAGKRSSKYLFICTGLLNADASRQRILWLEKKQVLWLVMRQEKALINQSINQSIKSSFVRQWINEYSSQYNNFPHTTQETVTRPPSQLSPTDVNNLKMHLISK